jgi:UDP-glucose 4-epimerase
MAETVLITGGAGFIGSHLADAALADGHRVVVLDDLSTGARRNVPQGATFVEGDVTTADLEAIVRQHGVTAVNHHAAQTNVRVSIRDPLFDAEVNLSGGLRLLEACRATGIRRVLFASSGGTVYGEQQTHPCDESHPLRPESPYGCSKLAFEQYLGAYRTMGVLDPVIFRYANVYGPRQDPKGEAGIVAILAEKFLAGEPPHVFGDGEQTRDYVFVDDVAAASRRVFADWRPGTYNVGTGRETTVNELVEVVAGALGERVAPIHDPPVPGELRRSSLDPAALRARYDWAPAVTVEEGVARSMPYYQEKKARGVLTW